MSQAQGTVQATVSSNGAAAAEPMCLQLHQVSPIVVSAAVRLDCTGVRAMPCSAGAGAGAAAGMA